MKKTLQMLIVGLTLVFATSCNHHTLKINDEKLIVKYQLDSTTTINQRLDELNRRIENQERLSEISCASISNQLDASSNNLTLFSILFAIFAVILGIYITIIWNKVQNLKTENELLLKGSKKNKIECEELLIKTNESKTKVEDTYQLIQNNINEIFLQIKREETIHILKRLVEVPYDVHNVINLLLSRDLIKEDYLLLKEAYIKLLNKPDVGRMEIYISDYKLLFFQHFLGYVVLDEHLCEYLNEYYANGFDCEFENDAIKSTLDFIAAIGNDKEKDVVLNDFLKGLASSKFSSCNEIYLTIFDTLCIRENQFNFFNRISDQPEVIIVKKNYGRILLDHYSDDPLSESESIIIEKINSMI